MRAPPCGLIRCNIHEDPQNEILRRDRTVSSAGRPLCRWRGHLGSRKVNCTANTANDAFGTSGTTRGRNHAQDSVLQRKEKRLSQSEALLRRHRRCTFASRTRSRKLGAIADQFRPALVLPAPTRSSKPDRPGTAARQHGRTRRWQSRSGHHPACPHVRRLLDQRRQASKFLDLASCSQSPFRKPPTSASGSGGCALAASGSV